MREASGNRQSRNDVKCTYKLTRLLRFSGWNKGTHLHSINNGDLDIVICVANWPPPLIFNTSNEVMCRLPQWYRLKVLRASSGLSRKFRTESPKCIQPQNIPCMWYATSANPDMLLVACPETSQLLQRCAVQIHTNNRHL